jgi:type IV secretion system protein VirB10
MMRYKHLIYLSVAVLAAIGASGCARKTAQTTNTATSDSLVASNPTERPAGDITPQTSYQEPQKQPETTPPPATHHMTTHHATTPTHEHSTATTTTPSTPPGITVAAGTPIKIEVATDVTSETATPGETWTGSVKENVIIGNRVVIPAGSPVAGVVKDAKGAKKGDRAMLDLAVSSINVNGRSYPVNGGTEPIIAGSTRARNLGAVAGGAAAGALIGKAIGGSGKGALIGGLIGGAAAAGGAAASKGYQVHIKPGTEITFTTNESVAVRQE